MNNTLDEQCTSATVSSNWHKGSHVTWDLLFALSSTKCNQMDKIFDKLQMFSQRTKICIIMICETF